MKPWTQILSPRKLSFVQDVVSHLTYGIRVAEPNGGQYNSVKYISTLLDADYSSDLCCSVVASKSSVMFPAKEGRNVCRSEYRRSNLSQ